MTTALSDYLNPLPLVAVLRGITPSEIAAVGSALTEHGFRILEVPLNSPEPFDSIKRLAEQYGERCLTGAGTVVKVADVARVADAGGRLIVMPHGDVAIVREAKRRGLIFRRGDAGGGFAALAPVLMGSRCFRPSSCRRQAWRAMLPRNAGVSGIFPTWWAAGPPRRIRHGLRICTSQCWSKRLRGRRLCVRLSGIAARAMSGPRFDLVALGEPLLEFNQTRDTSDQYLQGFGGDTSNCVIAAARLGATTAYITRLGDDAFGRKFLALWQRERVDASGVAIDADASTGIYFVTHGASGHEFSYLRAGSAASRMRPSDLPLPVIRSAKVLHVSGISQAISASACDTVFAAIDAAREAGARISFDCNVRPKLWPLPRARAVIVATMGLCDWFLPSLDEAVQLSGKEQPDAILDWCHDQGAPVVALKMGGEGAGFHRRGTRASSPARVNAIDATGAGDCFDGALRKTRRRGHAVCGGTVMPMPRRRWRRLDAGAVAPHLLTPAWLHCWLPGPSDGRDLPSGLSRTG
jgi:2-dehydro-3-deoxygluconokinase